MADYSQMKVPDLKKILQERGLVLSGNKADLIGRLQEDDKKAGGATATGEDEIDWDEDDKPAVSTTTEPTATSTVAAAGGEGPADTPIAVPNQAAAVDPSTTSDLKVDEAPKTTDTTTATTTETPAATEPEAPKVDFSIGLAQTDAEKEAERRAARLKRFARSTPENKKDGPIDEEERKKAERAKKFGLDKKPVVVSGLDSALPDRKRGREEGAQGGRAAKRPTPDRRAEQTSRGQGQGHRGGRGQGQGRGGAGNGPKKSFGKVTDDPVEKAKAEARALRFQKKPEGTAAN